MTTLASSTYLLAYSYS